MIDKHERHDQFFHKVGTVREGIEVRYGTNATVAARLDSKGQGSLAVVDAMDGCYWVADYFWSMEEHGWSFEQWQQGFQQNKESIMKIRRAL